MPNFLLLNQHSPISRKEELSRIRDFDVVTPKRLTDDDVNIIEFDKLNKHKYFPLVAVSGMMVRGLLYPLSLIKTRLQIQKHGDIYNGTLDAFRKIAKHEGPIGLYKGFCISNLFVLSYISYVGSFEYVRNILATKTSISNDNLRAFIAGGFASIVSQTSVVPVDIVSQHLQVHGMRPGTLNVLKSDNCTKYSALRSVRWVYQQYGVRGFYRGYFASIIVYAPNSAVWWYSYQIYYGGMITTSPEWIPRLALQCVAAPLAGATGAVLFTSLDAIKARVQVESTTFFSTARQLWREERLKMFTKGLSARITQNAIYSILITVPYETIKRLSIKDEYQHLIEW